jgi:hypothetical protein
MLVSAEPGAQPGVTAAELEQVLAEKRAGLMRLPIETFPYIHEMADELLHCDDMQGYYDYGSTCS